MSDIVDRLRHIADLWEPDEKSSIQLEAAAEIERLRAALAARTEECARVADRELAKANAAMGLRDSASDSYRMWGVRRKSMQDIAAAIRALPSPGQDTIKQEGRV